MSALNNIKRYFLSITTFAILIFISGCASTDIYDIEKLNYASAIGVDFKDGKYHGYIQFLDFQSVAKTSGQKKSVNVWVGEGVGNSFEEAFFNLYKSSQERVYWGHVTSVLITEAAFKKGFESISDSISRYYEFRLTPWVFGTRESIKDIFSTAGFFGQSPLSTILHEPEGTYSQASIIKSIKLHRLIAQVHEPGYTTAIPVLSLDSKNWSNKEKKEPKLTFDGAFFLKNTTFQNYMTLKDLEGLRWIQKGSIRIGVPVPRNEPALQIVFEKPKTKLNYVPAEKKPSFTVNIKARGYIVNRSKNDLQDLDQLTEKTKEEIKREIEETFRAGKEKHIDVYNLEHTLYQKHFHNWKSLSSSDSPLIDDTAIREINLNIDIEHSSSDKNRQIKNNK